MVSNPNKENTNSIFGYSKKKSISLIKCRKNIPFK